jgi:hypothetical protein
MLKCSAITISTLATSAPILRKWELVNEGEWKENKKNKAHIASEKMTPTVAADKSAAILGSKNEYQIKLQKIQKSESTRHKNGFW